MKILKNLILLLVVYLSGNQYLNANHNHIFFEKSDTIFLDTYLYDGTDLEPGDTLFLRAGIRTELILKNFTGSETTPIIITNIGGLCDIDPIDGRYGISVRNCRFIQITGTGHPQSFYGIRIRDLAEAHSVGMSLEKKTSDFEVDHIEIYNSDFSGIIAKSDPDASLSTSRDSFVQYNTHIHHNYIHDIRVGEGMYIGNTKYNEGMRININGHDSIIFPHYLKGVKIHDNIIERTGFDGIQVSSAIEDCQIYNNRVSYDSQAEAYGQMSGIILGGGSQCDCFNNRIENGLGTGILMFGLGNNKIYNNLIVNAGKGFAPEDDFKRQYGIFMNDLSLIPGNGVSYFNNTIVSPRNDGIRIMSTESRNNQAKNNLIVNPGAYYEYENDNTGFTGQDAYLFLNNRDVDIDTSGNFFFRYMGAVDFKRDNTDFYALNNSCCLIDAGVDLSDCSVSCDINHQARPTGFGFDVGAFESKYSNHVLFPDTTLFFDIYPNPASDWLKLKYTLENESEVSIQIVNPFGKIVREVENATQPHGTYTHEISLADINTGIYMIVVNIAGTRSSTSLLILR